MRTSQGILSQQYYRICTTQTPLVARIRRFSAPVRAVHPESDVEEKIPSRVESELLLPAQSNGQHQFKCFSLSARRFFFYFFIINRASLFVNPPPFLLNSTLGRSSRVLTSLVVRVFFLFVSQLSHRVAFLMIVSL